MFRQDGRITLNVASCLASERLTMLQNTIRKIEEEDLHCVSVFCSKGRHRSVSLVRTPTQAIAFFLLHDRNFALAVPLVLLGASLPLQGRAAEADVLSLCRNRASHD